MKKLLRTAILILFLVIVAAIVYTQFQVYAPTPVHASSAGDKVAVIAAGQREPEKPVEPEAAKAAATPAISPTLGTESSPVIVKLTGVPEAMTLAAEQEKNRDIQRGIERYLARIAATSLAQNFLLLFLGVIFFLMLLILFMLFENLRKFADAAAKSAEAARISAEMAEAAVARPSEKHKTHFGPTKFPPHYYRKR